MCYITNETNQEGRRSHTPRRELVYVFSIINHSTCGNSGLPGSVLSLARLGVGRAPKF